MARTYTPQDYNHDNYSDILWHNTIGTTAVWTTKESKLTEGYNYGSVPTSWAVAGHGDYNGDGYADVAWRNTDGRIAYSLNDKAGHQTPLTDVANPGTAWTPVKGAEGDWNGDHKQDILWQNTDGRYATWTGFGTPQLTGHEIGTRTADWHASTAGDYNKDGTDDIWWYNSATHENEAWFMQNGVPVGSFKYANSEAGWTPVGSGDFNNDGYSDVLWRNDDGRVQAWAIQGNTVAAKYDYGNPGTDWTIVGTGYYNADDYSDILWRNKSGVVGTWYVQGDHTIAGTLVETAPNGWQIQ